MKILITGGSGLLGQYLNRKLSGENDIITLYNENKGNCGEYKSSNADITDENVIAKLFSEFKPEAVIHTAAISRPELCDSLPEEFVKKVNVYSTEHITELCNEYDSKLFFTSTDLVYDGNQGSMIEENGKINPVSFYAETKLRSEEIIKKKSRKYIILRTSLLYGEGLNHSVNNFHNMLLNFKFSKKVKLFFDQFRTPLALHDAADILYELLQKNFSDEIINFGGRERISRTGLGEILCREGNFDLSLIERTSMYDMKGLHKVADVSMNTRKLQSLGILQKSVAESVKEILNFSLQKDQSEM